VAGTDAVLRRIERRSIVACALLALAAAIVTRGVAAPLGVAGGGALVAISYRGIKGGIAALAADGADAQPAPRARAAGLVKFFTRYAILAVAAYLIMARLRLPPLAVFAGASSLVVAVTVEALRPSDRKPPRNDRQ
jgi:hypothetical protein